MTEKNKVFFAADGITATSANHLCNIGKEYVASAHSRLDNIRFITTTVETLSADNRITLSQGLNSAEERLPRLMHLLHICERQLRQKKLNIVL